MQQFLNQSYSVRPDFNNVKLLTPSFYSAVVQDLKPIFSDQTIGTLMPLSEPLRVVPTEIHVRFTCKLELTGFRSGQEVAVGT